MKLIDFLQIEKDKESFYNKWKDQMFSERCEDDVISDLIYNSRFESIEELDDYINEEVSTIKNEEERNKEFERIRDEQIDELCRNTFDNIWYDFIESLEAQVEFVDENHLKIYRMITVESIEEFKKNLENHTFGEFEGIGECWSYHKNAANAHWGNSSHKEKICLTGIVPIEFINLFETCMLNMNTSIGLDEKEIRLISSDDNFIHIIELTYKDTIEDVNFLIKI